MNRKNGQSIIVIMFLIFAGVSMTAPVSASDNNKAPVLVAYLSGEHLKPTTGDQGRILFTLSDDGTELYYKLNVATAEKAMAAYIYLAPDGENGRAVVSLFDLNDFPRRGSFNGEVAEGAITADKLIGPLVGSPLSALLREMGEGDTYVKVFTEKHPQGYISGRIVDPLSFDN